MWKLTFAIGLAAGYVLGARAGQERYEQIAKSAREAAGHPAVVRARSKVKDMMGARADAVTATIDPAARGEDGAVIDGTV
ncbi:hypothetical protein KGQ20_25685 [Catenulispora sp. NF23]|uniref:Protoporphyrinogen oxidase n=1 Tax=Catenulispora pinistramenti TaxID=2705254 RepID=A0ABS5L192_9ACTN|nr:hypothetical protein [Catenulispora pinistramenti]MBS2536160.1 hypothetical protein [Catenulispora pinistramenti]MBS2552095.1 hypothetical protein [Catenulispora pinistramenti]